MATPKNMTKFKTDAQERALIVSTGGEEKRLESDHYVDGYAALYEPYPLFEDKDGPIYERFEPGCFDDADMTDVILQYDHAGRVYARTSNGSLLLEVDDKGLHMAADLSRTERARDLHGDIAAGMITRMSWRFRTGDCYWDAPNRTIVHKSVKKVYDVSAVSIPANDQTSINARAFGDGVIAEAARREAALEDRRRRLRLNIEISTS